MIEKYKDFLEQNGFFPVDERNPNWNHFMISHIPPESEEDINQTKRFLREMVGSKNGIYIYRNPNSEILYVGKGKPIWYRLFSHYLESFQEVRGDTKDKRWHRFFKANQGILTVFWCELEDEQNRQIIEKMLDVILKPSFNWNSENANHSLDAKDNGNRSKTDIQTHQVDLDKLASKYKFYHFGKELIDEVQQLLGKEFSPKFNKTGVTFYDHNERRILKIVNTPSKIKVEFNVPVTTVPGLIVFTRDEAKKMNMGTCQWIYEGESLGTVRKLILEAKEKFDNYRRKDSLGNYF